MTDLVSRLRELADPKEYPEHPALWERDMQLALREAAAELKAVQANKDGWQAKTEVLHKDNLALKAEVEALKLEIASLKKPPCLHKRFSVSPIGIRQCKDCFKTARYNHDYGWDWND